MFFRFNKKGKNKQPGQKNKLPGSASFKNGIRRIQSDDEILMAFTDDDAPCAPPETDDAVDLPERLPVETASENNDNKKIRRDKNGFPILDNSEELSLFVEGRRVSSDKDALPNSKSINPVQKKKLMTKHGIPILAKGEDFLSAFKETEEDEDFNEILSESLGEKTREVLLKEKTDKIGPQKQLSVIQRLARYPLPQGQIDLHGYTAISADLKAEAYIKNAFYNGTYTIRIIVGKGLHSPDGPVLPDVIEKRVLRLKNEKIVFAYEWDKKKKSKSGSIIVFLNNYHRQSKV